MVEVAGALLDRCATGLLTDGLRRADPDRAAGAAGGPDPGGDARRWTGSASTDGDFPVTSAQDPSFAARALGFAAQTVAEHVLQVRGSGWQAASLRRWSAAAGQLTRQQLDRRSAILRSAVRGAAGLSIAVGLSTALEVQHAFWVVLGSLSVLRSSALGTGVTAVRAVLGTAFGVADRRRRAARPRHRPGGAVDAAADHDPASPRIAPTISFAAGQAGVHASWSSCCSRSSRRRGCDVGIIRIEDVALGCAVSVVVGALFWPRGAAVALRHRAGRRVRGRVGPGAGDRAHADRPAAPPDGRSGRWPPGSGWTTPSGSSWPSPGPSGWPIDDVAALRRGGDPAAARRPTRWTSCASQAVRVPAAAET